MGAREVTVALGEMTKPIMACQSLTSDLLGICVALDATSRARLRDEAFRKLSGVHRLGPTHEEADQLEGFYGYGHRCRRSSLPGLADHGPAHR